jgi:hypothetical protein
MELKRDLVKYVRDKAKSKYDKGTECYICKSTQNLDFHHFHGLTELLEIWLRKNKLKITGEEDILNLREQFIAEHTKEIYDAAVTLCHEHHMKLHSPKSSNSTKTRKMGEYTERQIWHGMTGL